VSLADESEGTSSCQNYDRVHDDGVHGSTMNANALRKLPFPRPHLRAENSAVPFAGQRSFSGRDSGTVTIASQSLQPIKLRDGLVQPALFPR